MVRLKYTFDWQDDGTIDEILEVVSSSDIFITNRVEVELMIED